MLRELLIVMWLFGIIAMFTIIGLVAILIDSLVDAMYRQPMRGWMCVGILILAYHWRML